MEKVEEYYNKTATSNAYTFVMGACSFFVLAVHSLILVIVLDPDTKMSHFTKHWTKSLQDKALESTEAIVCLFCLLRTHAFLLIFDSLKSVTLTCMV